MIVSTIQCRYDLTLLSELRAEDNRMCRNIATKKLPYIPCGGDYVIDRAMGNRQDYRNMTIDVCDKHYQDCMDHKDGKRDTYLDDEDY